MENRIPCVGCILQAVCRYKSYEKMVEDCSILKRLLYQKNIEGGMSRGMSRTTRTKNFNKMLYEIQDAVKPLKWKFTKCHGVFVECYVLEKKEIEPWKKPKFLVINA